MKLHPISLAIVVGLTTSSPLSVAQESSLETITVTSSRTAVLLKELATSVEIINQEDIQGLGNVALADILRSATSIGVSNSGGAGKNTTLRIRGEEGFRTRLYLDGVELSDPSAPQVSPIFDDILSSQIRQVEILRGAQGFAYGADAGGVINVSSHVSDEGLSASVNAQTGRYSHRLLSGDITFGNQHGGVFLAATDLSTGGFNAQKADTSNEKDGYDNTTLHLNGHVNISDQLSLRLVVRDVDADNEYDGCFDNTTFAPSNNCSTQSSNRTARISANFKTDNQSHTLGVAKTDVERRFYSNDVFSFANEGEIEKADYVGTFETDSLRIVLGGDIEKQAITNAQSRYQRGIFSEVQSAFADNLFINAGLRYDDNDTFGSHTSFRIGGAYLVTLSGDQVVKFKSTYGTGFRAPSLFEQSYNDGPFAFGEAAGLQLKEETSKGFDLGVEYYQSSGIKLEAVLFNQTINDEIMFDGIGFQGYLQGTGSSKSKGVETSVDYPLSRTLSVWGNYTYNDSQTSDGEDRLRRPRHTANLGLSAKLLSDALGVNVHIRSVKDAFDIGGTPLDDYSLANVTVSYDWSENLKLHLRAENLLDKEYEEVAGFNTAERSFYAGVSISL